MKKLKLAVFIMIGIGCVLGALSYNPSALASKSDIKLAARRASTQISFYTLVWKVSFTTPLEEEKELSKEEIEELVNIKISEEFEKSRLEEQQDKYKSTLTRLDTWGYKIQSKTFVPLGAVSPKWAKFPERVLVVYKIKKEEISAWEKEYEKDVLAISEVANVSPTQAKSILMRLKTEGYTVSRETAKKTEEVTLLWFDDGWDDSCPLTLGWKVSVHGSDDNLIVGYDSRGILEINPVGLEEDSRLHIEAGYFDLKDEFKPKSTEETTLENKIDRLKEDLEEAKKALEEKKEKVKRDISKATWIDVNLGLVKIEQFWYQSLATGVFLGNMKINSELHGWVSTWGGVHQQFARGERKGVILTNAHVAHNGLRYDVYVTEDKEIMWIIFPGTPFVRYTQDSDMYGSPAQILSYDYTPILSGDYDCALMVTTEVPSFEKHKAKLGDSSNVEEGDSVIMVGNPSYLQKFLTEGVVSNKEYDITKSPMADWLLSGGAPRQLFNWLRNSNFWFDTPIGVGGTSGSGVWALEGSEKGKVIALHNMGLVSPLMIASAKSDGKEFKYTNYSWPESNQLLKDVRDPSEWIKDYSFRDATFRFSVDDLIDQNPTFKDALKECGLYVNVAGMNGGIPINKIKAFLQERGIDPENFGWEPLENMYWEK